MAEEGRCQGLEEMADECVEEPSTRGGHGHGVVRQLWGVGGCVLEMRR